jgi:Uma2 family endonuclease
MLKLRYQAVLKDGVSDPFFLMILLGGYIRTHKLGAMFDSSTAFTMKSGNKRSPDRLLKTIDALDGEEVIPGFTLPVADLFQTLFF